MKCELDQLPIELEQGELVTRYAEWGAMAVRLVRAPAGTDMGPVLEGLAGDRCPSPHWGIVLEGAITMQHADGSEELTKAGEAYYWPAGHSATTEVDAVFLEVGPVVPMREFGKHAKAKFG